MASEDDALRRAQRRVGRVLRGKWTLDRLLGVGGMAAVYAGTHRNGTHGAIKILHADLAMDAELRARFLREGYAANSIGHTGVVRAIDDDEEDDGSVFLVMELLEGESVEARAARQGRVLPPNEVLALADQALDILAAAHDAGVIHRDIKPENLFLTTAGEIKLLDFGIARVGEPTRRPTGTRPGATMGTPVYMAPEQARGRWAEVDGRTDLWAVGATMFTLISGHFVHEAETENEQLLAAMSHHARSLASVAPGAPARVVEIVDRALQYDKESRWPDARAMQHAVRLAYHALFGKPITTAPRLQVPEDETLVMSGAGHTTGGRAPAAFARTTIGKYLRERKKGVITAAAAGVLLLIIGAGIVVARGSGSPANTPRISTPALELASGPAAAAMPSAEPSPAKVPTVSPSELPPAEADGTGAKSNPSGTTAQARPSPATRLTGGPQLRSKPIEKHAPRRTTEPSVDEREPKQQHDILDQQW